MARTVGHHGRHRRIVRSLAHHANAHSGHALRTTRRESSTCCTLFRGRFTSHDPDPFEALEVGGGHLCELNYAITLALHGELEQALSHFQSSERLLTGLLETDKCVEPGMLEQRQLLAETLGVPLAVSPPGA